MEDFVASCLNWEGWLSLKDGTVEIKRVKYFPAMETMTGEMAWKRRGVELDSGMVVLD